MVDTVSEEAQLNTARIEISELKARIEVLEAELADKASDETPGETLAEQDQVSWILSLLSWPLIWQLRTSLGCYVRLDNPLVRLRARSWFRPSASRTISSIWHFARPRPYRTVSIILKSTSSSLFNTLPLRSNYSSRPLISIWSKLLSYSFSWVSAWSLYYRLWIRKRRVWELSIRISAGVLPVRHGEPAIRKQ